MNILVTGGAGFIGSHTVVALVEAGFNPIILDNFSNSDPRILKGLTDILGRPVVCYESDVCSPIAVSQVFSEHAIDGVIHFAAHKAVGESMRQPLRYYRNNLLSMINLIEVMAEYKIANLIFSSSCTVYGNPARLPVTEETPVQPAISVYGNTKQIGEEILQDTTLSGEYPLKAVSLRYFNPIGAHPSGLIGELPIGVPANLVPFVTQTAAGLRNELTVFGDDYDTPDGSCIRDYIHVMDLAEAHVSALKYLMAQPNDTNFYDVFNVGTGHGNSVLEIVEKFQEVNQTKLPYQIGPRREGDIASIYADVKKSVEVLGWKAKRTLEECLRDAWRWQKSL